MSEHLLTDEIKDYLDGKLSPNDLLIADDHLAVCDLCYQQTAGLRERQLKNDFVFFPDSNEIPAHLSYERLENYVDEKVNEVEREISDLHLRDCAECRAELNGLVEMRNLIAADLQDREIHQSANPESNIGRLRAFLSGTSWLRFGIPTMAVLLIGLLFGLIFYLSREKSDRLLANSSNPNINQLQNIQNSAENLFVNINSNSSHPTNSNTNLPKQTPTPGPTEMLPQPYRSELERVLAADSLNIPAEINQLKARTGELMSGGTDQIPFALSSPVGKIIQTDRPVFQWRALKGAEGYLVNVYDANFNKVATSPQLSGTTWQLDRTLSRSRVYLWQVTAIKEGKEIKSPIRPAPDAKFKVLDAKNNDELSRLSRQYQNRHLFLGIMYAKAGLLDQAAREFQKELTKNPNSNEARKFLQEIQRQNR